MANKPSRRSRKRRRRSGRARTWWHPLLAQLLRYVFGTACEVREEVSVGRMPYRLDMVVVRGQGALPEQASRELPAISQRLNRFTVIEFTGPTDLLEHGDFDTQRAHVHLFRGQQTEGIDSDDITLIVVAPSLSEAFRQDVRLTHYALEETEHGIRRLLGPPFATWVIETDVVAGVQEPILSLFSSVFLRDQRSIIQELSEHGYQDVLSFACQQIEQFRKFYEGFAMQHKDVKVMDRVREELINVLLPMLPPKDRLRGLSPSERREGIPPEEWLKGIPPEEIIRALGREQLAQLEDLLRKRRNGEREPELPQGK
jgi:hypothetical protein